MAKREKKVGQHIKTIRAVPDEVQYLIEQFGGESDRACVILAATVMEECLSKIIKSKLIPMPGNTDPLFDGANAPIGTFSAKIIAAYRLGLISKKLRDSLHIVRKIRNDFAHDIFHCNFENQSIRDRLSHLRKVIGSRAETAYKDYCRISGTSKLFEAAMEGSIERQQFFVCAMLIIIPLMFSAEKIQSIDKATTESALKPSEKPTVQVLRRKRATP